MVGLSTCVLVLGVVSTTDWALRTATATAARLMPARRQPAREEPVGETSVAG